VTRWNVFLASILLSVGLGGQSYGFDLLDQLLGTGHCGCQTKCCQSYRGGCGGCGCAYASSCGCGAAAECGVSTGCGVNSGTYLENRSDAGEVPIPPPVPDAST